MRCIIIILLSIVLINTTALCQKNHPEIIFEKTVHNFKKINFDSKCSYDFNFKNTGNSPLTISKITTTCGCTVAEKPQAPIAKKKKSHIRVWYDTDKTGKFSKTITIYSNAKNSPTKLMIKGFVKPKIKNK